MEKSKLISSLFLFDGCNYASIDAKHDVTNRCFDEHCHAGEIICSSEKKIKNIYIVFSGIIRIESGIKNHSVILRYVQAGESFGAGSVFLDSKQKTKIISETESALIVLKEDLILELISEYHKISLNYLRFLSNRVSFLNEKISFLASGSAEAKLALYLLSNSDEDGTVSGGKMSDLAKTLGLGRASLYRAVEMFSKNNIIEYNGGKFKISDKIKLSEIVN